MMNKKKIVFRVALILVILYLPYYLIFYKEITEVNFYLLQFFHSMILLIIEFKCFLELMQELCICQKTLLLQLNQLID